MTTEIEKLPPMEESFTYFSSAIHKFKLPEYLQDVELVANEYIDYQKKLVDVNELYPVHQTQRFDGDQRINKFTKQVVQIAWNLLDFQGYEMQNINTFYESMWAQEHHKYSSMEQHTHNGGVQLVGFYFLEVPKDSMRLVLHDPRPAKMQIDLPEKDMTQVTLASRAVNFMPEAGDLYFTNAWLPHSFTRHGNNDPIKYVHINIGVRPAETTVSNTATVI